MSPYTYRNPSFVHSHTGAPLPNTGGWQDRHLAAVRSPNAQELPLLNLLGAWLDYANAHHKRYGNGIGEDGYAVNEWAKIGRSLIYLLSMDHGSRLDSGTLDTLIRNVMAHEDVDVDTL